MARRTLMALLLALPAVAQEAPPVADPAAPAPLLPGQALGVRSRQAQNAARVADVVLLVPDTDAFLQALSLWTPTLRFPILFETEAGRDDCARFIRAFAPRQVLRFPTEKNEAANRATSATLRERVTAALHAAWDADDEDALRAVWRDDERLPLGAVVLSDSDPAWPAALALAAGRGQLLLWSDLPRQSLNSALSEQHLQQLVGEIGEGLTDSGFDFAALGDDIDAITVCLGIAGKFKPHGEDGALALTDILGRGEGARRFAYAGWLFADDEADAAYRAMCSLFLHVDSALFFDSYSGSGDWGRYAVDVPAKRLAEVGIDTRMTGAPGGDFAAWQSHARGGLNYDFVHVNTMGNQSDFQLARGTGGWARDVPVLNHPAVVHFIHSWSAASPGSADALAGRWLEHGCYLYVGAVHEPYLGAFLTPTDLVNRLLAGFSLGAAVRRDEAPPWKVQLIGDPLWTLAREGERTAPEAVDVPGEPLTASLKTHLRDQDLVASVHDLVLLGRDADAARLIEAALRDAEERTVLPDLAWAGLGALHRAGSRAAFADAFTLLGEPTEEASRGERWRRARDLLWSKLGTPAATASDEELRLLARHLRWRRPDVDAIRIAEALAQRGRSEEARALLQRAVSQSEDEQALRRLQKAIERL